MFNYLIVDKFSVDILGDKPAISTYQHIKKNKAKSVYIENITYLCKKFIDGIMRLFFITLRFTTRRLFNWMVVVALTGVLATGCQSGTSSEGIDLRLRGWVDSHNKASFMNRYQDPQRSIDEARTALAMVRDSLPNYHDGRLRAYNNLAFGYYMLAQHDSATVYVDSVLATPGSATGRHLRQSRNTEVERLIAQLMKIRLLQRSCRIADSYQLLYDIDQSALLRNKGDNYLYAYAQMEYYITSLTLNYHYRNSAVASSSGTLLDISTQKTLADMLHEVEEDRPRLKCDYAEDMSLNYALAHSYYRLASASGSDARLLAKAYQYLSENLKIMLRPNQQSIYHLANVFQLQAFIVADTNILPACFQLQCSARIAELQRLGDRMYPYDSIAVTGDYGLDMFDVSTDLFFQTPDPYQHLGAVVAAAEYCLRKGEYDLAYGYYARALADSSWHDGMAPKFEAMLYDGLIRMGFSPSLEENQQWYAREMELLTFIRQNESADAMLQDRLTQSQTRNRNYVLAIIVGSVFLLLLGTMVLLLHRRSKVLRAEKAALQEVRRQNIERIANVETCLSVLRHDINPFLTYLTNRQLSSEMRQEVLDQLLRTFANIKSWTNLSIPSGLQFQPSVFALSEVFESVAASCVRLEHDVDCIFYPTTLKINGDRGLVEIMLRNLVNNALQHTHYGKVTIYAEVYPQDSRFVHIEVDDTGTGMDEETLENLFRADKKVKTPNDPSADHGTGFGLILCKYIIKRHDDNTVRGCRIWAESEPGKGSTFHCLLAGDGNEGWQPEPWRKSNQSS
jgi:signal transduction histidine kinase